jgi:hypothetical protein
MAFLEASVGKMKKGLDTVARRIVIEIGSRLELRSPVGNPSLWMSLPPPGYVGGAFRRNWQHGFGSAPTAILEGTSNAAGQEIRASVNGSPAGGVHYVVNNLPYAIALENGHSGQAPQGMVGLTVLEFPEIVRQAQG